MGLNTKFCMHLVSNHISDIWKFRLHGNKCKKSLQLLQFIQRDKWMTAPKFHGNSFNGCWGISLKTTSLICQNHQMGYLYHPVREPWISVQNLLTNPTSTKWDIWLDKLKLLDAGTALWTIWGSLNSPCNISACSICSVQNTDTNVCPLPTAYPALAPFLQHRAGDYWKQSFVLPLNVLPGIWSEKFTLEFVYLGL